jgi:hypothetical protein
MNMSSNASAGPIAMDTAKDRLIYVDRNPANRFIGERKYFTLNKCGL